MAILINGEERDSVPATNLGLLGWGAVEGLRVINTNDDRTKVVELEAHLDRLEHSLAGLKIKNFPYTRAQIRKQIFDLITLAQLDKHATSYIRLYALAGNAGKNGESASGPQLVTQDCKSFMYPLKKYHEGLRVTTDVPFRRVPPQSLDPSIKSILYGTNCASLETAQEQGFDDALMKGIDGDLQEGTFANVLFIAKDGTLVSPPEKKILPGKTRGILMDLWKQIGRPVHSQRIDDHHLPYFTEALYCGTQADVIPVISIDDQPIGEGQPGPQVKMLRERYWKLLRE